MRAVRGLGMLTLCGLLSLAAARGARADSVVVTPGDANDGHGQSVVDALSARGITAELATVDACRVLACLGELAGSRATSHALRYVVESGGGEGDHLHVWLVNAEGHAGDARVALGAGGPAAVVADAYSLARSALLLGGHGVLSIVTVPAGAAIGVDGEPAGHAPLDVHVQAGVHRITADLSGFASERERVEVEAGRTVRAELSLHRLDRAPAAALRDAPGSRSLLNPILGGVLIAGAAVALLLAGDALVSGGECESDDAAGGCTERVEFGHGDAVLLGGGVLALGLGVYFIAGQPLVGGAN